MGKVFLFLSCIFLLFSSPAWAGSNEVVISEIGAYEANGYEWVEIVNIGSKTVDLVGWKFWENGVSHRLSVSSTDSLLDPGEFAVIVQDEARFRSKYPQFANSIFDSSWGSLKEAGEEIGLQDSERNFVEKFVYLSARKTSLQRKDLSSSEYSESNWQEHDEGNSVGGQNVFMTVVEDEEEKIAVEEVAEESVSSSVEMIELAVEEIDEEVVTSSRGVDLVENDVTSTKPIAEFVTTSLVNKISTSTVIIPELVTGPSLPKTSIKKEKTDESIVGPVAKTTTALGPKLTSVNLTKEIEPIIIVTTSVKEKIIKLTSTSVKAVKKEVNQSKIVKKKASPVLYLDISQVRQQPKGKKVQVSGVVSVLPGVLGSQYMYIQDQTGGIQVYQYQKSFPVLQIGDQVNMLGEVSESRGQKRIKLKSSSDMHVAQAGMGLVASSSTIKNLSNNDLGKLIKVRGEVTEVKGNYLYLDGGQAEIQVYLKSGTKLAGSKYKVGQQIKVVGILEQGGGGWQLWPRSSSDVETESSTTNTTAAINLVHQPNSEQQKAKKTLLVTAGGVGSVLLGLLAKARGLVVWQQGKRVAVFFWRLIKK